MSRSFLGRVGLLLILAGPSAAPPASGEWLEVRKIRGADAAPNDQFSSAMALEGDRLAVGAWVDDSPLADAGSVYLFERKKGGPEGWGQVAKLTASDARSSWNLGTAVSLDGNTVAAAATGADDGGAVYIYERQADGQWAETAKLTRPLDPDTDTFGDSVAIEGDTVFVGSEFDNEMGSLAGAVWVYKRHAAGPPHWRLMAKLTAQRPTPDARFGNALAVDGDILAVGAYKDREKALQAGAVHIFERDGSGAWVEVAKLMASDGAPGDLLSKQAVAISGWRVVAGATESGGGTGAAYVFERDEAGVWAEAAKLTASDPQFSDFGMSVAIHGDLIVVGDGYEGPFGASPGAAYSFRRQVDGLWVEVAKIKASDGADLDLFGNSVAAGPATVIVGAIADDDAGFQSGSAYIFLEREVNLSLAGLCPGEVTLTLTGATPQAPVALLHGEEGMSQVPGGPCAGTQLALANPRLAGVALSDLTGGLTLTRVLESPACDRFVQALDLATCAVSGVAALP